MVLMKLFYDLRESERYPIENPFIPLPLYAYLMVCLTNLVILESLSLFHFKHQKFKVGKFHTTSKPVVFFFFCDKFDFFATHLHTLSITWMLCTVLSQIEQIIRDFL